MRLALHIKPSIIFFYSRPAYTMVHNSKHHYYQPAQKSFRRLKDIFLTSWHL